MKGVTMELRHLRYFVAIAEERSFTRAAERLWVAQPGLSTQIRRLEAELGVQLFIRHTRGVDLTDAGSLFFSRAQETLAAAELASRTGRDIEDGIVGSLRIGLSTTPGYRPAERLLDSFARLRPAVEVTTVEAYGGALARDLCDGRLDAVVAPSGVGTAELDRLHLGSEPWVVLVARAHKLGVGGPVSAEELRDEDLLITGHRDAAGYDRAVLETLKSCGVEPSLRRGAPGPALLSAVSAGEALALSTEPGSADPSLVVRPLDPPRTQSFELLWQGGARSSALTHLISTAEELAQSSNDARRPLLRAVA
jgi:DNA-binding transcriptional LysR family regulator